MSRCIWALVDEEATELIASLRIADPMHWVFFICCNIPKTEGSRILITCCAIWHARRKAIHEGVFKSPFSIISMVNQLIQELAIVQEFESKMRIQHQPKIRTQCQIAIEQGTYKTNTDAAVDPANSKGAIAAVCRGSNGEFVAASAMNTTNVTDPETLEAMACLEALALAEDCAIKKMIVVSDCLNVIRNIKKMNRCVYMMILQDIQERSKSFECARFAHEGREFNREAHSLAKHVCSLGDGRHVWFCSSPVLDVNAL